MNTTNKTVPTLVLMRIVWGAILFSMLILAFVLSQIIASEFSMPVDSINELFAMDQLHFYVPVLGLLFGRRMIPKVLMNAQLKQQNLSLSQIASLEESKLLPLVFASNIVKWATTEAIVIFGFVIAVQTQKFEHFLPLFFLAFILHLMQFPNTDKLRTEIESSVR